jgi:hypothetical protein
MEEKKDGGSEYLEINMVFLSGTRGPYYIDLDEFNHKVKEAEEEKSYSLEEQDITVQDVFPGSTTKGESPRLVRVIDFLSLKCSVNINDLIHDEDELIIKSSFCPFLELPWEQRINDKVSVIRKVVGGERGERNKSKENNLLFLLSQSYKDGGSEKNTIKEDLDEELEKIFKLIPNIKKDQKFFSFNFRKILVCSHTTKNCLQNIDWGEFDFVHMVMHGNRDGSLSLEKSDDYKQIDKMSIEDFLKLVGNYRYTFFFLSLCYSGGGLKIEESLSFKLSKKGISDYVIGYNESVGGKSGAKFAEFFYLMFLNKKSGDFVSAYKEALIKYKNSLNGRNQKYFPFLYIGKQYESN